MIDFSTVIPLSINLYYKIYRHTNHNFTANIAKIFNPHLTGLRSGIKNMATIQPGQTLTARSVLTRENLAKISALKKIPETKWIGNIYHPNLETCLTALNMETLNSGWYNPVGVQFPGVKGSFLLNQDGSIYCEARITKKDENKYLVEWLDTEGWNLFEVFYHHFFNQK